MTVLFTGRLFDVIWETTPRVPKMMDVHQTIRWAIERPFKRTVVSSGPSVDN